MMMPNFLIIGAAKAGTTTLYDWLTQHPQIYMTPVKETNFFALEDRQLNFPQGTIHPGYLKDFKTTWADYQQQFDSVEQEIAIGEACPSYLYYPEAVTKIKQYLPNVKLIAILRNPIERAYSNFVHHLRDELETTTDFAQALKLEQERIDSNWWWGFHYLNAGFYAEQLKRYFQEFPAQRTKIYLFEELKTNSDLLLQDIFEFLEVDQTFVPQKFNQYNVTGIPKNRSFYKFLTTKSIFKEPLKIIVPPQIRDRLVTKLKNKTLQKSQLAPEIRQQLIKAYRKDILELQQLINKDLSSWLE